MRALERWPIGVLIAVIGLAAGCASTSKAKIPIRIMPELVSAPDAELIAVPFGQDEDGTRVVLAIMSRAFGSGADRVTDMVFHFAVEAGEQRLRCRREVVARRERHRLGGGTNRTGPLRRITRFVRERALGVKTDVEVTLVPGQTTCGVTMRGVPVCSLGASLSHPETMVLPEWGEYVAERYVSRYAFEFDAGFVPPDWRLLAGMLTDELLALGPATCHNMAASEPGGNFVTLRVARYHKQVARPPATLQEADVWRYGQGRQR